MVEIDKGMELVHKIREVLTEEYSLEETQGALSYLFVLSVAAGMPTSRVKEYLSEFIHSQVMLEKARLLGLVP